MSAQSKKDRIAKLVERVDAMSVSASAVEKRHREELERRDRDLAAAGFLRVQDVLNVRAVSDPWRGETYTAEIVMSRGSYMGLGARSAAR